MDASLAGHGAGSATLIEPFIRLQKARRRGRHDHRHRTESRSLRRDWLSAKPLASLSAELTRRERVLAAAGAKDIEQYTERGGLQHRYRPLPRLVIVIDEFASLTRDLPNFVTGLIGIAQRGRFSRVLMALVRRRPAKRCRL